MSIRKYSSESSFSKMRKYSLHDPSRSGTTMPSIAPGLRTRCALTNEEKALITREVFENVAAVDEVEIVIRERKSSQQIYPLNATVVAVKINVCPSSLRFLRRIQTTSESIGSVSLPRSFRLRAERPAFRRAENSGNFPLRPWPFERFSRRTRHDIRSPKF